MDHEKGAGNPYSPPADSAVDRTTPKAGLLYRVRLDAASMVIAALVAIFIRLELPAGSTFFAVQSGLSVIGWTIILTSTALAGIWTFRGYSADGIDNSLQPVVGIVVFAALVALITFGLTSILAFPVPAGKAPFISLQDIVIVPRSVLLMTTLFGVVLVMASRRFMRIGLHTAG